MREPSMPAQQPQPILNNSDLATIQHVDEFGRQSTSNERLAKQEFEHMFRDGAIIIALILVRAWHFASPLCWRWLDEKDNHNIERVVFSGIILSLASKYFKRYKFFE